MNIRSKWVITRKAHKCFGCGRAFPKKSRMMTWTYVEDGISTDHICETCEHVYMKHISPDEIYSCEIVDYENWEEAKEMIEPKTYEELADSGDLCGNCPIEEGSRGVRNYGNGPVMCEGISCSEAYERYLEEFEFEKREFLDEK